MAHNAKPIKLATKNHIKKTVNGKIKRNTNEAWYTLLLEKQQHISTVCYFFQKIFFSVKTKQKLVFVQF